MKTSKKSINRIICFATRNIKELIRDPLSIIFCVCLPLFFLVIFQQFNIPVKEYKIEYMTPAIIVFAYSFITLFTATLISKDTSSLLLSRLFSSPMKPHEYVIGYSLALLPLTIVQTLLFFAVAILLKLPLSINIVYSALSLIPISILFIALGILIGILTTEKQAGPLSSIVIQLVAFTSGMWFEISIAGNVFKNICQILPFYHVVNISRSLLLNNQNNIIVSIIITIIYTILIYMLNIVIFNKKMSSDNK